MANDNDGAPASILTPTQRAYLRGETDHSGGGERALRSRIRRRVQYGLDDFHLLTEFLGESDRDKIFTSLPDEWTSMRLDVGVRATIEFLYTGLGGGPTFRDQLKYGVQDGEVALGNIDDALEVEPRFAVEPIRHNDIRTTTEAIEAEEWGRLRGPDLFAFIDTALAAQAIDFEKIDAYLDAWDEVGENLVDEQDVDGE